MITHPTHCRQKAYDLFASQVPILDHPEALLRAAVAISMHEMEHVELPQVEASLEALAIRIRARVHSTDLRATISHAHEVLFEEEGFTGNTEDYYNPLNSYVPAVLQSKRGLPITLNLIYKDVLARLGVRVDGINAPDHFLAGVEMDGSLMLVDSFFGGRIISRSEVFERIEQVRGHTMSRSDDILRPATHAQWLSRMLMNLQNVFARAGRKSDAAAMGELRALLEGHDV